MRNKLLTLTAAGVLALSGVAVAGPALAATTGDAAAAVSSRVDRITEALAGLVGDGTITQDQADQVAATLEQADLGPGGPGGHGRPGGPGGHGGPGGGRDLSAAATALGLTEDELRTALDDGQTTLAQVAEEQGVDQATLVDALVAAERERIAQAVTDGRLTQEQADERLAGLTERVTERVTTVRPERGGGPRPGGDTDTAPETDSSGTAAS